MKQSKRTLFLTAILAAGLAIGSAPVDSKGRSSGARSKSAHNAGHHHHRAARVFVGGTFVASAAHWPWWDYPPYGPTDTPVYYIEKGNETTQAEWFYCPTASAYFPYVAECPGGWQRVAPQLPAP